MKFSMTGQEKGDLLIKQFTNIKKTTQHMMLKIVVLASDRHTNVVRLNQLVGPSLLIIGSPKAIPKTISWTNCH
jgi:hypothetical protein